MNQVNESSQVCEICHSREVQQELPICNWCFIKWKMFRLLKASGSCLGTLLIGGLIFGGVGWVASFLLPVDVLAAASGIAAIIGALLFLGLVKVAVEPINEAGRLSKNDLAISMREVDMTEGNA